MSLIVSGLTKRYGKQWAIDQLNFSVEKGEILAFLGPNGAGKTTTLKIITGYIQANSGSVYLDETEIRQNSLETRKKIGYLPEHNPLYLDMYVIEFLEFIYRAYSLPRKDEKRRIAEMIEITGLVREQHKKIGALSKGYRQRVGLAQAMIHNPALLILDEPTTGLDPNQIIEIRNLISDAGKNTSVIFSTHLLTEAEAIADRVLIIHKGRIVADENMHNIRKGSEEHTLRLGVEKPGFDWGTLQNMAGVMRIRTISDTLFEIDCKDETDIRKDIFHLCVNQNNPILELVKQTFTLEDTFHRLTQ